MTDEQTISISKSTPKKISIYLPYGGNAKSIASALADQCNEGICIFDDDGACPFPAPIWCKDVKADHWEQFIDEMEMGNAY